MFIPEPTSNFNISILLFLQLTLILLACRSIGWLAKKLLGQPQVVGEMIAGVVLGPSLLGMWFPEFHESVFPPQSRTVLYNFAQVGLVLYMFLVGLEFDLSLITSRLRSAVAVSVAGIATPFALGCGLAAFLLSDRGLFTEAVTVPQGMLFMGAAMSITAFPMLARIIYERGLSGTRMGTLALAAGSSDDAAAWCILAVVLASFKGDAEVAVWAIGGGVAYAVALFTVGRALLARLEPIAQRSDTLSPGVLSVVLMMLMLAAWYTDAIGIYAVFGAFMLGAAMPRGVLNNRLQATIGPLTTVLILPLFFVYSGLNTRIGLVDSVHLWLIAGAILAAAVIGKFAACALAARATGEPWRDSLGIGALMNARGLMELIILNIGLEAKIITPTLFSVMVIMAIVTTLMATPCFELICGKRTVAPGTGRLAHGPA
ncbi:MAG: cation:proton antiporter [Planctomycetota bacterium]|nr:cation:proton antiporter [Planctomycetota bacterium]